MPCYLVVYNPQTRVRSEYTCDEDTTTRVVEDDHAAGAAGEYTDVSGQSFRVDWTQSRLVSFLRKRVDGSVIASGDADGAQTAVP